MTAGSVRGFIFDMDGLLVDTEPGYLESMQLAAHEQGHKLGSEFMLDLVGRGGDESYALIRSQLGTGFDMQAFGQRWPDIWRDNTTRLGIDTKPCVLQLLDWIHELGLPLTIATATHAEHAARTLELSGLKHHFDAIVTGDQVVNGKPAPDIYLRAASLLGLEPELCLAFEDSVPGVTAASSAGIRVVMVPDLKSATPHAESLAHSVCASLCDSFTLIEQLTAGSR